MADASSGSGEPLKKLSYDERLYQRVKPMFAEMVDPRPLLFYLELKLADEERVREAYESDGRCEAASLLLRLLQRRSDWDDQLITALRNPNIALSHLADDIERKRGELLVVVDVHMEDMDEEEPMEVDSDPSVVPEHGSEKQRLSIFTGIIDTVLKELVQTPDQLKQALTDIVKLLDTLFVSASCGCLELLFQVRSLRSLSLLRMLYQGGALQDALTNRILNMETRQRIHKEAAIHGISTKKLSLTVKISDEDFSEIGRNLSSTEIPRPDFFWVAKSAPVDPFGDGYRTSSLQNRLEHLPASYKDFINAAADVITDDPRADGDFILKDAPICFMFKELIQRLHGLFRTDADIMDDLMKISLNILVKAFVSRQKNVSVVNIISGEVDELVWGDRERSYVLQHVGIPSHLLEPKLSSSINTLIASGWLSEVPFDKDIYWIVGPLRRDYLVAYMLPQRFEGLPMTLYYYSRDALTFANTVHVSLFQFANIFLSFLSFYERTLKLPESMYVPEMALFMSSEFDFGKLAIEKFMSLWDYDISDGFDNYWHWLKAIASNNGHKYIQLCSCIDMDSTTVKAKTSIVQNIFDVDQGNVIHLPSIVKDDLRLALRAVAVLDMVPLPVRKAVPSERVAPDVVSSYLYTEQVEVFKEGSRIVCQTSRINDYSSTNRRDWSFTLDMSACQFNGLHVPILTSFLPQLDHITHFSFNNTKVDTVIIKQIIAAMNPNSVQGMSVAGCAIDITEKAIGLSRLWSLKVLDLENTGLSDKSCQILVHEIEHLTCLKQINIGCNSVTDRGLSILMPSLLSKANLIALRVHDNKLGWTGAVLLSQMLFFLKHLEMLSVWGCALGDDGVDHLSQQFTVHTNMRRLSIRDNNLSSVGSSKLYKNLIFCKKMEFIDTNESSFGSDDTKNKAEGMLDMLKASAAWDHISLWNCSIGKLSVFENPDDLKSLSGITYLCLQKNGMSDDNIKDLSICIARHFKYLQHLNLRENMVGDDGAKALANALARKRFLAELWLDWNMFGHTGAKALVELALGRPNMTSCNLSFSFQLAPPERKDLAMMVGSPVQDGELYVVERGLLKLQI